MGLLCSAEHARPGRHCYHRLSSHICSPPLQRRRPRRCVRMCPAKAEREPCAMHTGGSWAFRLHAIVLPSAALMKVSHLRPDLVAHLPDAKQSLALAWCESYGIDDLKQLSNPRHLVDALSLPEDDTAALLQRFLISRSPTSAPDGVALRHAHHPSRTPPRRQLPWQWPSSPTPCK